MSKDFIEAAQGNLMLVSMKLSKRDLQGALKQANFALTMLSSAGQQALATQVTSLISAIQQTNVGQAQTLLVTIQGEVGKLLNEEKEDIQEHKTHLHVVSEFPCPSCRGNAPKDAKFCPNCGYRMEGRNAQVAIRKLSPAPIIAAIAGRS